VQSKSQHANVATAITLTSRNHALWHIRCRCTRRARERVRKPVRLYCPSLRFASTFEHLTCRQIGEEQKRVTRAEATGGRVDGKPGDPDDIALLKGAMEALEEVSIEKNCNIEFQHG
jgi:hypothetical protein